MLTRLAVAALLLVATPSLAADLDPKLAAKIKRDQKKALDEVAKAHGNKKTSELSSDERREVIRQQASAQQAVLDQHGVSSKDYARYTARLSRDDQRQMQQAERDLEAGEEAAKGSAPKQAQEVKIQRGFSNKEPVELESTEGAPPVVEHGLPAGGH